MHPRLSPLFASLLLTTAGAMAQADPIPQDWLSGVTRGCMTSCQQEYPAATCQVACTCVTQQTAASVSKDEFSAMNDAVTRRTPMPPALAGKFAAIQDRCRPAQ